MLGGRGGLRKWRPSHVLEASDAALAWPWRGPGVALACYVGRWCGARFRPLPHRHPEREHVFFDASEEIRVHPEGNACSGAGVGSKSGDPLTLLTPLTRP